MNDLPSPLKQVEQVLTRGPRDVVELVEELLLAFQSQAMRLEWGDGECRFQCLPLEGLPPISVPLPKSVFRAILARLATLCNQCSQGEVSPYGGQGDLFCETISPYQFQIEFSNNQEHGFHLEIFPVGQSSAPARIRQNHPLPFIHDPETD